MGETTAIVLAAGKSRRMNSDLPKVLHEVCGRPMLSFVLNACRLAGVGRLVVVVGHGQELVTQRFEGEPDIHWVEQAEQKGTGHAVLCCRGALRDCSGSILVIAGDMPLVRRETLASLVSAREETGDALSLATTMLEDPAGYGRIVRDAAGRLESIVEHRSCTPAQREIQEANPSYYCFDSAHLWEALERVPVDARTGEHYITETVSILRSMNLGVSAKVSVRAEDATGINSRLDLATVNRLMQDRIQLSLMNDGVTIVDPDNTWIEAEASIGMDSTVYPFSYVGAGARIGEGCRIGPMAYIAPGEVVATGTTCGPLMCSGALTP